jgi:FixJ family two-component response regulator
MAGHSNRESDPMQTPPAARPQVVAVVDDDSSVRGALRRLCRTAGYDAWVFGSAKEFLTSVESQLYDCAIVDIRMPEMDGFELQRRLLMIRPALPVILITAHDEPAGRARALATGAVAYLRKPFFNEELLGAIRCALEGRHFSHDPNSEETP